MDGRVLKKKRTRGNESFTCTVRDGSAHGIYLDYETLKNGTIKKKRHSDVLKCVFL